MTPILLDMQAFGPYLHQTKIDFTELGRIPCSSSPAPPAAGKPPFWTP